MSQKKVYKVLAYCDSPVIETGFAQVAKQILKAIKAVEEVEFDITIIAINHYIPYYDQKVYPYKIYTGAVQGDVMSGKLFEIMLQEGEYDILFTFNDLAVVNRYTPQIMKLKQEKKFIWITYSPVDRDGLVAQNVLSYVKADIPVAYTNYAKEVASEADPVLKTKLKVIYHGSEPEVFFPFQHKQKLALRKEHFRMDPDVFLITNVNRNQWRKDLARTMLGFREFKKALLQLNPEAKTALYVHAKEQDQGGSLTQQAEALGLVIGEDLLLSEIRNEGVGIPRESMNIIYNISDVIVSTTTGEGWGLSTTEAMAARTPVIMPRNTSLVEMVGENEERGYLAKCGGLSLQTIFYGNQQWFRPLVDVDDFVQKLSAVYNDWSKHFTHEDKGNVKFLTDPYADTVTGEKIEAAQRWAVAHDWQKTIGAQWQEVFRQAIKKYKRLK